MIQPSLDAPNVAPPSQPRTRVQILLPDGNAKACRRRIISRAFDGDEEIAGAGGWLGFRRLGTTQSTSNFTVEVTDSASHTASQALSIAVYGSTIVRITTASLPNWTVGQPYSQTLAATSGTKPYTWSLYSGSLPSAAMTGSTTDPSRILS